MTKTQRDGLVALSLANLCFLNSWRVLLNPLHYTYYHWKYYPGFIEYAALLIDVLLLAALFWGAMTLARRSRNPAIIWAARFAFLLALFIPLNDLRLEIFDPEASGKTNLLGMALLAGLFVLVVLPAVALKKWRPKIIRGAVIFVLILSPFILITFLQGAWLTIKNRSNAAFAVDKPTAPPLNKKSAPRVVWIVFDELDMRMAFAARPRGLELPELDRLRGQSIFANNAHPPADHTLLSMPSMIIGKAVKGVLATRADELSLTLKEGGENVPWSAQPNVFSEARAAGFDTALVGWYHPYCRVIGESLTSCFWEPVVDDISPLRGRPTILKSMSNWATRSLFRIPGMFRIFHSMYDSDRARDHTEEHLRILEQANVVVKNRSFGLTLLHFPVPHHPFIYDRSRGALSDAPDRTYEDNLVLTDRTLGEMRRDMESAGLWEETTVIVTSDHWWRTVPGGKIDPRVPFIMKLPGQTTATVYDADFNTVITSRLILALLGGEVTEPQGAVQWLDRNAASAKQ